MDSSLLSPPGRLRAGERFTEAGQAGSEGMGIPMKVSLDEVTDFFARFGRLAGSEVRARRLLARLLGDDQAMERALAAAEGVPAPSDVLWQTDAQKDGYSVGLKEMLDAAPKAGPTTGNRLQRYLDAPETISLDWKEGEIFFPETEFIGADGSRCVHALCWDDARWDRHCFRVSDATVSHPVFYPFFVAVPASAAPRDA
jgi:hypothetical protein